MTEHQETVLFANWLRSNGYLFFKTPSETFTTSWNAKRKNSLEWASKWFPDMVVVLKRGSLAFVEMKKKRWPSGGMNGSKIGEWQREWIEALDSIPNVAAKFCHGFEEAREFVTEIEDA